MAIYNGTGGNDNIFGSTGMDTIYGHGGADALLGASGADIVYGGSGNDHLLDGDADGPDTSADSLYGEDGDDTIYIGYLDNADGGIGSDSLLLRLIYAPGALVADFSALWSGASFQIDGATIQGFEAISLVKGTQFDDYIVLGTPTGKTAELDGYTGNDVLIGGVGNDIITSGILATDMDYDELYGGNGDDWLRVGAGDYVEGGLGTDSITLDVGASTSGVTLNFALLLAFGSDTLAGTYFSSIEDVRFVAGSAFADVIDVSTDGYDTSLSGRDGNDTLRTGAGANTLDGGLGADTMYGGAGNDTYYVDQGGDVVVESLGAGNDMINSAISLILPSNVEQLYLSGTAANGNGNDLFNNMIGNDSGNILKGLDGDDTLNGGAGNDILYGGAGNDFLDGGLGADTMYGDVNNDTYYVDDVGDVVSESGGGGTDAVFTSVSFTLPSGVEDMLLVGVAAINGTGNTLSNGLTGNSAANSLLGGGGNDSISGMDGADILSGGAGQDFVAGGLGGDQFVFTNGHLAGLTSSTADRIVDFNRSQGDKLNISGIDAITGGSDNAFVFIGTSAFSGVAGQLRYEVVGGTTMIFGDMTGDGGADMAIALTGSFSLIVSDFFL